jgi:hypothetical protein
MAICNGDARVAQLVEHMTENHGVGGSIPSPGTIGLFANPRQSLKKIRKYADYHFGFTAVAGLCSPTAW